MAQDLDSKLDQKTFHIAFCHNVFHLMTPSEKMDTLRALYAHLKPGGTLFVSHIRANIDAALIKEDSIPTQPGLYMSSIKIDGNGNPDDSVAAEVESLPLKLHKTASPQGFVVSQNGTHTFINRPGLVHYMRNKPRGATLFRPLEVVSKGSLLQKCIDAGIPPSCVSFSEYYFNSPQGTQITKFLPPGLQKPLDANATNFGYFMSIYKPKVDEFHPSTAVFEDD